MLLQYESNRARGKIQPISKFSAKAYKLPIAVFGQTISGTYFMRSDNVQDRDMVVRADLSTLRLVPWASEPTASVIMDCFDDDGAKIGVSPLDLADDVFHFKRTLKRVARAHGIRATFLAKVNADKPGSSLHVHQSVYDDQGANVFSGADGEASDLFSWYLGGLQHPARYITITGINN